MGNLHMRLAALLGLALLALPAAHAQGSPPTGLLDLQFSAANKRSAMFFQRPSISWNGRTAQLWIFMAMPEGAGQLKGGWFHQTIDCSARTIAGNDLWPVDQNFAVGPALAGTAKPAKQITPNSMDESISKVVCDGATFHFDRTPATDLQTAWTQAQDVFKSLAKPATP